MSGRRPEDGQNFLRSRRLARQLLAKTSISSDDLVLDIGAGRGALTEPLAERCRRVVAYEIDPRLFRHLKGRFRDSPNVTLVQADFLKCELPRGPYKVCASLPFNITADAVAKLTSGLDPPQDAYLVVQREAAERFMVDHRQRITLVACLLYPRWRVRALANIPATAFLPLARCGCRAAPPEASASSLDRSARPRLVSRPRDSGLRWRRIRESSPASPAHHAAAASDLPRLEARARPITVGSAPFAVGRPDAPRQRTPR